MAIAKSESVPPPVNKLPVLAKQSSTEPEAEWWVKPIAWVALVIFIAVPVFSLLVKSLAGRIVWTIVVAALPLFIVLVGYHRWRRICPLALFSQIPVLLRRPGARKASPWFEANYYYVSFAVFFASLWLRLVATNGDGVAIATGFVLIALAAFVYGVTYTGKTWCNYICPLSFIEKIYTEPHGLRATENSQCAKCTACKTFCPDINEENGYWKEIASRPKRFVYFAFPGLVWAFYFYYYLQAGTWDYYFGNEQGVRWTNQPGVYRWAFSRGYSSETAGFYFFPVAPRALAAFLTLAVFGLLSLLLFGAIERIVRTWLRRRDPESDETRVRHVMFSIAAFAAFVAFYTFAGSPSLRRISPHWAPHLVTIVVVVTGSTFLLRRMRRTQSAFAEETLGRNIIKRWPWTDIKPPKDLQKAFLIHTVRTRETAKGMAQMLEIYKEAIREALGNGFVTSEEVRMLESLRNQLHIKQGDHDRIMTALADEERALISDPAKQISAEKRLQLRTYGHALQNYLERVLATGSADDLFIKQLRTEYGVTSAEHTAVLDQLLGAEQKLATRLAAEIRSIERAASTIPALELQPCPTHDFLIYLLRRRRARAIDRLIQGLSFTLEDETNRVVREGLSSSNEASRQSVLEILSARVTADISDRLVEAHRETALKEARLQTLTEMLQARTQSVDPYVRAVSLYSLGESKCADEAILLRLSKDEHELVRETATHVRDHMQSAVGDGVSHAGLVTIERMIALRSAPIFSRLDPEELVELARSSREEYYGKDRALCHQGEPGNEVFILLAGEVRVLIREGDDEKLVSTEQTGGFIGEMAVLDPAPRSATIIAGEEGARVLCLDGEAFREALNTDPTIAAGVISTLAQRLRKQG